VTDPAPEPERGARARALRTNRGACGGRSPLPPGRQWAPHQGFRERLRRHRQVWAEFERLCARDGYAATTRERLLDHVNEAVKDEPLAPGVTTGEATAMGLVLGARCLAETDRALSWVSALNRMLNEAEAALDRSRAVEASLWRVPKEEGV